MKLKTLFTLFWPFSYRQQALYCIKKIKNSQKSNSGKFVSDILVLVWNIFFLLFSVVSWGYYWWYSYQHNIDSTVTWFIISQGDPNLSKSITMLNVNSSEYIYLFNIVLASIRLRDKKKSGMAGSFEIVVKSTWNNVFRRMAGRMGGREGQKYFTKFSSLSIKLRISSLGHKGVREKQKKKKKEIILASSYRLTCQGFYSWLTTTGQISTLGLTKRPLLSICISRLKFFIFIYFFFSLLNLKAWKKKKCNLNYSLKF